MKKVVIALSIACAGALAFADTAQWNSDWFTGIGSNASALDSLNETNGYWTFPDDNAGVTFDADATAITFELDDGVESTFTVGEDAATAKTEQQIVVKGVFVPCSASDLSLGSAMNANNAQLGFAVVTTTADDSTTTYKYYAWTGKREASENAIEDWVLVGTCANPEEETELTITISYWGGTAKASFSAVNGSSAAVTLNDQELTSTASTAYTVSSVACTGSGTISALTGSACIAVASVGDVLYSTAEAAIAAAVQAGSGTVTLLANPSGSVTIGADSTVTIDQNGKTVSDGIVNNGTMTIALSAKEVAEGNGDITYSGISGEGSVSFSTTDETKTVTVTKNETSGNYVATVDTKDSVVEAIKFASKNLVKTGDTANLKKFLYDNCPDVYKAANSTTANLQTALEKGGKNNLPLWQSYVLGISSDTSVAPDYVTSDEDEENITISIPALKDKTNFGNYTVMVSYSGGSTDNDDTTYSGSSSGDSLSTLKLPLNTTPTKYTLSLKFSTK